jgi:hypothetical protein
MKNNKNYKNTIFLSTLIIIIVLLFMMFYYHKMQIDHFDNLEHNLYSYDTCCSQKEIKDCESYGKTGVCNYREHNKSCICQNAF